MKGKVSIWLATLMLAGFAFGCGEESDDIHGTQDTPDCTGTQTKCGDDGKSTVSCQKSHWRDAVACPLSAPLCDTSLNRCVECSKGSKECDGEDQIKSCNDQGKWDNATSCPSEKPICKSETNECVAGTAPACQDGEKRCDGNDKIQECSGGAWGTSTSCPTETPDCDTATNSCIKKVVTDRDPGEKLCEGANQIKECDNTGHWGAPTACPTETPICKAETNECIAGSAPACTDGEKQCDGNKKIKECSSGAWGDSTECPAGTPFCSDTLKKCTQCIPGVDFCFGGNAESAGMFKCKEDGTKGENIKFCECNKEGTACADTGKCTPGETKCSEGHDAMLSCNSEGSWDLDTPLSCGKKSVCNDETGKCECTPGDKYCGGSGKSQGLYECKNNKEFRVEFYCTCKDENSCEGDAECSDGARKCDGNTPKSCKKGKWVEDPACSRSETCNETVGSICIHNNAPATDKNTICGNGETKCVNNMLYKCNNGLYEMQYPECDGSGVCKKMYCITTSIAQGAHQAKYDKSCNGAQYCTTEGTNKCDAFGKVTTDMCGKSQTCILKSESSSAIPEDKTITAACVTKLCDELYYKCDGTKLSVCNNNHWVELADCSTYGLSCQAGADGACVK